MSVDEYLRLEQSSPVRHEYVGGVLYAFAGASERHVRLCANLVYALVGAARGTRCRVLANDMLLQASEDHYYYPDLQVVCDPGDTHHLVKRNPCLIVEVLSPSTANIDRREKLVRYHQLSSLRTYLMVHRDARHVERWWRDDQDAWRLEEIRDAGAIPLMRLPGELTLAEIYGDVLETTEQPDAHELDNTR